MQSALLGSETAHSRAAVESQRCMGIMQSLHVEIAEELGERSGENRSPRALIWAWGR